MGADHHTALVEQLGAAVNSGLPLEHTLEALAEDVSDRSLSAAARQLAAALERGQTLEQAAAEVEDLPPNVRALLAAGVRCGNPSAVFESYVREQMISRSVVQTMRGAASYPLLVLALLVPILLLFSFHVIPIFGELYADFSLEVPPLTRVVLQASRQMPVLVAGVVIIPLVMMIAVRVIGGRWLWHRALGAIPILGRMWVWSSQREFAGVLSALLDLKIPADEAITYTGQIVRDRNVGQACRFVHRLLQDGLPLSGCLGESIHFDRTLTSLVSWGEQHNLVSESLHHASQMFVERIDQYARLVRRLLPPFTFVVTAAIALTVIAGLMLPLIQLIQSLN